MTISEELTLSPGAGFLAAWVIPFLTVAALSMLQMSLCLYIKPVVSFMLCISQLILAVYWDAPYILGNGAMVVRSGLAVEKGHSSMGSVALAIAVMAISVIAGALRFRTSDILNMED